MRELDRVCRASDPKASVMNTVKGMSYSGVQFFEDSDLFDFDEEGGRDDDDDDSESGDSSSESPKEG